MKQRKSIKNWLGAVFLTAILILFDQVTKVLAVNKLKDGPVNLIPGVFQLQYLENHGAAFGILQGQQIFFYLITALILLAVIWFYSRIPGGRIYRLLRLLCAIITAGAVGNLIDRIGFHYVRDFLYFSLIDFPIFNVADIYVTCSAVLFVICILFVYKDDQFAFLKGKRETRHA